MVAIYKVQNLVGCNKLAPKILDLGLWQNLGFLPACLYCMLPPQRRKPIALKSFFVIELGKADKILFRIRQQKMFWAQNAVLASTNLQSVVWCSQQLMFWWYPPVAVLPQAEEPWPAGQLPLSSLQIACSRTTVYWAPRGKKKQHGIKRGTVNRIQFTLICT